MATRNVSRQAQALARARERRRALDRARDEHDRRIEQATADALIALEVRVEAAHALDEANRQAGQAIKVLLEEEVTMEKAAALLGLETTDIRRLTRSATNRRSTATESSATTDRTPRATTHENEEQHVTRAAS